MSLTRGGVQPRPQFAYSNPGAGIPSPAGSNQVTSPATIFVAAGAPQPMMLVPGGWIGPTGGNPTSLTTTIFWAAGAPQPATTGA